MKLSRERMDQLKTKRIGFAPVHSGGQASVGHVVTGGRGSEKRIINPMHPTKTIKPARRDPLRLRLAKRCLASTRRGTPCQSPAVNGKSRCRMHGGARGSGAPTSERNGAYKHGERTNAARARRKELFGWIRVLRETAKAVGGE